VLAERAGEFFELPQDDNPVRPEHFMLSVCKVGEEAKARIPAVTHVDGTARVQIVLRERNPLWYDLIAAFGRRTGVPVILNTSFNLKGEPIVSSPEDAIKTFEWSGMDHLVIGRFVADRPSTPSVAAPFASRPQSLLPA
jgi:carbamoyltransferase